MSEDTSKPADRRVPLQLVQLHGVGLGGHGGSNTRPCARIIRVMCSGRVDPAFVLKAFALGADGVLIAGCHPGDCHYIEQNYKTIRRHSMLRYFLEQMGDRSRPSAPGLGLGGRRAEPGRVDRPFRGRRAEAGPPELVCQLGRGGRAGEGARRNRSRARRGDGGPSMSEKGKLALYWAASCGGCEIAVLGIHEKILDVAALFDIVLWPVAVNAKVRDVERMPDESIDVCLFNGGIRTSEQEYMAQLLRKKSKVLVAFGSCASEGCIPRACQCQFRKGDSRHRLCRLGFHGESRQGPATAPDRDAGRDAAPARVLRYGADPRPDGRRGLLPARLSARGRADLGGDHCDRREASAAARHGDREQDDGVPGMQASEEREREIKKFLRTWEVIPDSQTCLLEQGLLCCGIATRAGCNALCPQVNSPCIGCYGPSDGLHDHGARMMTALASVIDATDPGEIDQIIRNGIPDPVGSFYRFGLAGSQLHRTKRTTIAADPAGGSQ